MCNLKNLLHKIVTINKKSLMLTIMSLFYYFIALIEFTHAFLHCLVLFGIKSVAPSINFKRIYFTSDLLTVIISYSITNCNTILVFIHVLIHVGAILYLFGVNNHLYENIFKLGEQKWKESSHGMKIFYIIGTVEDVLTHVFNFYYLILCVPHIILNNNIIN